MSAATFDSFNVNNTLYMAHNQDGKFYSDLFLPSFLKWLLTLPGLICNPALVYITIQEKKLHGPCNILLAIGALFDGIYLLGYSLPLILTLFAINFIPLMACFFIQLIPLASLFASVNTVFFVGFDRLLNVLLPFHYHRINHFLYLSIDLCLIFAYSAYAISFGIPGVWANPNWAVICFQSDMYAFVTNSDLSRNGLYINGTSFVCYIIVWFIIWKFKKQATMHGGSAVSGEDQTHRIFKSVLLIMFLVVGCYLFNTFYTIILAKFLTGPFFAAYIAPGVSLFTVIIASTSNPPILYICSKEYRRAFQRLLLRIPFLKHCFKKMLKKAIASSNAVKSVPMAKSVQPAPVYFTGSMAMHR